MKLDWITDPHLDHLKGPQELIKFVDKLHGRKSDGLLITGDIAEGKTIYDMLGILSGAYRRPIYFVLGNHDYYGNWMAATKQTVRNVCDAVPRGILNWLTECDPIRLSKETIVIGHDGFYDGRCGSGSGTNLGMTDFMLRKGITDLAQHLALGSRNLFEAIEELALESADHIENQIRRGVDETINRVIILTHVPPFHEASYFRGRPSDDRSAPYYVNKTLGERLRAMAELYPHVQFDVYAGHTHGKRVYEAEDNLTCRVGGARYGRLPTFQTPIEV